MKEEIIQLFRKYLNRTSSAEELERVLQLIQSGDYEEEWEFVLSEDALGLEEMEIDLNSTHDFTAASVFHRVLLTIQSRENPSYSSKRSHRLWTAIAVAASLLLISGLAFYFSPYRDKKLAGQQLSALEHDIRPGGNKAYLTLSNGQRILLKEAKQGLLAKQTGVNITKSADGQLIYSVEQAGRKTSPGEYNTVETPKGGQYQINLPDGTRVWLNAASSLKYPVSFTGIEKRLVELKGEAYFEVTKDKHHPFIVKTAKQEVKVLGTHFNVNAYPDEGMIRTTLVEGLVELDNSIRLQPGEQAVLSNGHTQVRQVDTDEAIAWKNGYFMFANEDIYSVMRKISRWYDVEVIYEGKITGSNFNGLISRFSNVSDLLHILKLTKTVHFKVEGRRITVMP